MSTNPLTTKTDLEVFEALGQAIATGDSKLDEQAVDALAYTFGIDLAVIKVLAHDAMTKNGVALGTPATQAQTDRAARTFMAGLQKALS